MRNRDHIGIPEKGKNPRFIFTFLFLVFFITHDAFSAHFTPVWGNQNPQVWMNIMVTAATIEGVDLAVDDEIAVFDVDGSGTEQCVGFTVLTNTTPPFFVNAGKDEGNGGFTPGNAIIYRMWDNSEGVEITLIISVHDLTPPFVDVFTPNGLASVALSGYKYNTWTGSVDSDWNTSSNWNTGLIPDSSMDVFIPATGISTYPELTSTSTGGCNNITLESTASGQGSILGNQYLTVNGTAYIQRFISGNRWHMITPSTAGLTVGFYGLGGNPKVYLSEYDEALETYSYLTDPSTPLNDMQGYLIWVDNADHTYSYTGSMNTGTFGQADNLTRNSTGSGNEGWNLVGNPYPSTIDWNAASGWTRSANLGGAIYIFNNGAWEYYLDDSPGGHSANGSRYIAPGQGFFVKVLSGSSSTLMMNDDVRVNNAVGFLKSGGLDTYLKLVAQGNDLQDETIIRFIDESTDTFDGQYDVFKKFSTIEESPQVYTSTDENYFINSVPVADQMPVHFKAGVNGEYVLSLGDNSNIADVWLEDLLTGTYTNLLTDSYSFTYQVEDNEARFLLHFGTVSVDRPDEKQVTIWSSGNRVHLTDPGTPGGVVTVYNLAGQRLMERKIYDSSTEFSLDKKGFYIVSYVTEGQLYQQKIIIQ